MFYRVYVEADFVTESESPGLLQDRVRKLIDQQGFGDKNFQLTIKRMNPLEEGLDTSTIDKLKLRGIGKPVGLDIIDDKEEVNDLKQKRVATKERPKTKKRGRPKLVKRGRPRKNK